MSSITQAKDHHWKLTANRKNRLEAGFQSTLPQRKYTPLKDNSMRDSKVFERSRERSNSSFAGLNRSRDIDTNSNRQRKQHKLPESTKSIHGQTSVLISAIKNSEFRISDSVELARQHVSAKNSIIELQKEFKQFKEKVMKLIQRQQEQINQLAKDLLNTFQFELTKLKEIKLNKCDHCQIQSQTSKHESKSLEPQKVLSTNSKIESKLKTKEIQDIKQQLNKKLEKLKKPETQYRNDQKAKVLQKAKSSRQIPILDFEKIHSRFDNVFDIFNKLKSDMNEMEEIKEGLQKKNAAQYIPLNQAVHTPKSKK